MVRRARHRGELLALLLLVGCGASRPAVVLQVATSASVNSSLPGSTTGSDAATSTTFPAASSTVSTGDTSSGWVESGLTEAVYISWLESAGQLTGTMQIASLDAPGATLQPRSIPFTGQHAGEAVSLDLSGIGLWQGTLTDGVLLLRVPKKDGTIGEVRLTRGAVDDYNAGVAVLQRSAGLTQSSIDEANAAAAQTAQLSKATSNLALATSSLRDEVSTLPDVLGSYDDASHRGMIDAQQQLMQSIAVRPLDCGMVMHELSNVTYAGSNVTYYRSNLDVDVQLIGSAVANVRDSEAKLLALDPSASVLNANAALSEASKAIAAASARGSSDDAAADQVVASAMKQAEAVCPAG